MRRTPVLILSLALAVPFVVTGCKAKELADKASIAKDLQSRGTTDLMKEVANDQYTPPEDGRLTDGQIQMYMKVREHEKKIAEVAKAEMKQHAEKAEAKEKSLSGMLEGMKALGSAADFMTADIRAAKDLGYNSQEYLWVKTQILAASTSVMAEKFNETITSNFDKAYEEAKKAYDEAKDEQTKKVYADMLAGYDKSKQEMQQNESEDPALTHNRQLLAKYENVLNAYAQELSKYADKPDEVQKSVDEMNKKLEEATKE
jgi:ribosomal protein S17E